MVAARRWKWLDRRRTQSACGAALHPPPPVWRRADPSGRPMGRAPAQAGRARVSWTRPNVAAILHAGTCMGELAIAPASTWNRRTDPAMSGKRPIRRIAEGVRTLDPAPRCDNRSQRPRPPMRSRGRDSHLCCSQRKRPGHAWPGPFQYLPPATRPAISQRRNGSGRSAPVRTRTRAQRGPTPTDPGSRAAPLPRRKVTWAERRRLEQAGPR